MCPNDTTPLKRCSKCKQEFPATTEYFNIRKDAKDGLRAYCRSCHVEYATRWAEAHPVRAAENARRAVAAYRSRNREVVLARTRDWRRRNPEQIRKYMAQWRHENDARLRAERLIARADERNLSSNFMPEDWQFAVEYFEGICAVCQRPAYGLFHTIAADHWIPLSSPNCPGTITTNIVPLCCGVGGCNESKSSKEPEQWLIDRYGEKQARDILDRIQEFFSLVRN